MEKTIILKELRRTNKVTVNPNPDVRFDYKLLERRELPEGIPFELIEYENEPPYLNFFVHGDNLSEDKFLHDIVDNSYLIPNGTLGLTMEEQFSYLKVSPLEVLHKLNKRGDLTSKEILFAAEAVRKDHDY